MVSFIVSTASKVRTQCTLSVVGSRVSSGWTTVRGPTFSNPAAKSPSSSVEDSVSE